MNILFYIILLIIYHKCMNYFSVHFFSSNLSSWGRQKNTYSTWGKNCGNFICIIHFDNNIGKLKYVTEIAPGKFKCTYYLQRNRFFGARRRDGERHGSSGQASWCSRRPDSIVHLQQEERDTVIHKIEVGLSILPVFWRRFESHIVISEILLQQLTNSQ